jgi:hypothetical protein
MHVKILKLWHNFILCDTVIRQGFLKWGRANLFNVRVEIMEITDGSRYNFSSAV